MKFYKIQRSCAMPDGVYRAKFDDAKTRAKELALPPTGVIVQVEIPTDQAGIEKILNDEPLEEKKLRAWELTSRGGFKEIPLSELE